jgi:vacuolar-type H+-ATPase subunit H
MEAELGRLLEAERTFAARIDAARRDGRALVDAARVQADALGSDSTLQLSEARRALAEEEERVLSAELARLDAETTARVDRLAGVDEGRVAALADLVLKALLSGGQP